MSIPNVGLIDNQAVHHYTPLDLRMGMLTLSL